MFAPYIRTFAFAALLVVSACGAAKKSEPAIKALDAISQQEWLNVSSIVLLDRVVAASSKAALDEAAKIDPRAQALVGTAYFLGKDGYAQNDAEAAKFYRLAAGSSPIAQNNLANMLLDGKANGGTPAPDQAAAFYKLASAQGHAIATSNLAMLYKDGRGVDRNYVEAARLFEIAANRGYAQASFELGGLFECGCGVEQDYAQAMKRYEAAAAGGSPNAHFALGEMYLNGRGVKADVDLARAQYDKGAAAGDADSLYALGDWHMEDAYGTAEYGGDDDYADAAEAKAEAYYDKAVAAYERDAAGGDVYAMRRLGDINYKNLGVIGDNQKAFKYYSAAAAAGDTYSLAQTAKALNAGAGVPKDEKKALSILRSLVEKNDPYGQSALAWFYEREFAGLKSDQSEAIRLYQLAARQGETEAQTALTRLDQKW